MPATGHQDVVLADLGQGLALVRGEAVPAAAAVAVAVPVAAAPAAAAAAAVEVVVVVAVAPGRPGCPGRPAGGRPGCWRLPCWPLLAVVLLAVAAAGGRSAGGRPAGGRSAGGRSAGRSVAAGGRLRRGRPRGSDRSSARSAGRRARTGRPALASLARRPALPRPGRRRRARPVGAGCALRGGRGVGGRLRGGGRAPEPPPWRSLMASISWPLRILAVPLMPSSPARPCSSASTMPDRPAERLRAGLVGRAARRRRPRRCPWQARRGDRCCRTLIGPSWGDGPRRRRLRSVAASAEGRPGVDRSPGSARPDAPRVPRAPPGPWVPDRPGR